MERESISQNVLYASPYYCTKPNLAIIIAFVIPGNPYPVIEHPNEPNNLSGAALRTGSQSHYVVTAINGFPVKKPTPDAYDELVVVQEGQVFPAFIITPEKESIHTLRKKNGKGSSR